MARKCSPPKSVPVKSYSRAPKRRKAKPKPAKAGSTYWVVVNERTGRTSGTRHRDVFAAARARQQLDLKSFRAGNGRPWSVDKRTAK